MSIKIGEKVTLHEPFTAYRNQTYFFAVFHLQQSTIYTASIVFFANKKE